MIPETFTNTTLKSFTEENLKKICDKLRKLKKPKALILLPVWNGYETHECDINLIKDALRLDKVNKIF